MDRRLAGVIQELLKRAQRRGFVTMMEIQRNWNGSTLRRRLWIR